VECFNDLIAVHYILQIELLNTMTIPRSVSPSRRAEDDDSKTGDFGNLAIYPQYESSSTSFKKSKKLRSSSVRISNSKSTNGIPETREANESDGRHNRFDVSKHEMKDREGINDFSREPESPRRHGREDENRDFPEEIDRSVHSEYSRRKKVGMVDNESSDEAIEFTKKRYKQRKSTAKSNSSRQSKNDSLKERRVQNEGDRTNSESTHSANASGTITKVDKLFTRRRFKQRAILAKQKATKKLSIGAIASDLVSLVVGQLDFNRSLGFSGCPSVADSDPDDEYNALASTNVEQIGKTNQNQEKEETHNIGTTFFQLLSWDERKTDDNCFNLHDRDTSRIDANLGQSIDEETLNSLILTKQEHSSRSESARRKNDAPPHVVQNPFTSRAFELNSKNEMKQGITRSRIRTMNDSVLCSGLEVFSCRNESQHCEANQGRECSEDKTIINDGCRFKESHLSLQRNSDDLSQGHYTRNNKGNLVTKTTLLASIRKERISTPTSLRSLPTETIMVESTKQSGEMAIKKNEGYSQDRKSVILCSDPEEKRQPKNVHAKKDKCSPNDKAYTVKLINDEASLCSVQQKEFKKLDLVKSRVPGIVQQSEDDEIEAKSNYNCIQEEKRFKDDGATQKNFFSNDEQPDHIMEVGVREGSALDNDDQKRNGIEHSAKKKWPMPVVNVESVSTEQNEMTPTLKELMKSIDASSSNPMHIDDLLSNIDDVVHSLIKEGKLPRNGMNDESSDRRQRALSKHTAELVRNLSVLRAHRVSRSNEGISMDSQTISIPSAIQNRPSVKLQTSQREHRCSDVKWPEAVLNHYEPRSMSKLAKIRARRDEAAMRIKKQTYRMSLIKDDSTSSAPRRKFHGEIKESPAVGIGTDSFLTKSLSSKRLRRRPKPEDMMSQLDGKLRMDLSIHNESSDSSKVNREISKVELFLANKPGEEKLSTLEKRMIPLSTEKMASASKTNLYDPNSISQLSIPNRYMQSKDSATTATTPARKNFSINEVIPAIPRSNSRSGKPVQSHTSSPTISDIYSRKSLHKTQIVRPSRSDIDMQEWEKIELKKLPLILNPSRTERGESRDEWEDYHSATTTSKTYDTDENYTSYSGDEDTMGDETTGSTSDSQRLKNISSMIEELRLRRRNQLSA